MSERKKEKWKNITIIFVAIVAILVVGYSAFAQPLAVKTATTDSKGIWNIGFTNAAKNSVSGNATELAPVDYTENTATFYVYLGNVGDQISYDFTIKNSGSLDAKVESIYMFPENEEGDAIIFQTSGLNVGDTLDVGESTNLQVTATFNPSFNGKINSLQKSVTVIINYVEK